MRSTHIDADMPLEQIVEAILATDVAGLLGLSLQSSATESNLVFLQIDC
jgi:hypothetical protein